MGLSNVNPQGWADNTPYGTLSSRETKKFDVDAYESAAVRQQPLDRNDHLMIRTGYSIPQWRVGCVKSEIRLSDTVTKGRVEGGPQNCRLKMKSLIYLPR